MAHTFTLQKVAVAVMVACVPLASTTSAWALGSNTTSPAVAPATPGAVSPSLTARSTVGAGGCAQQYTAAINAQSLGAIISNDVGLAANAAGLVSAGVGAAADVVGLTAQSVASGVDSAAFIAMGLGLGVTVAYGVAPLPTAVGIPGSVAAAAAAAVLGGSSVVKTVANVAQIVGAVATVASVAAQAVGVASQISGQVFSHLGYDLAAYAATLPNCDSEFAGTVKVTTGGVNITGGSIFNGDVGVAGAVNVQNAVTASRLNATQGISAVGGAIRLGDTNGTSYSDGITLGGGALSGAGSGGLQAFTGDVNAVAIGNNAQALASGSVAMGLNASATAVNAIAIGTGAVATASSATAIGSASSATATNATAIGASATASAANSVALGAGSVANQDNTVSVGSVGNERRITNVAAGTALTDAANVGQVGMVQTALTAEASSRVAGDAQLQSNISIEAASRSGADEALMEAGLGMSWTSDKGKVGISAATAAGIRGAGNPNSAASSGIGSTALGSGASARDRDTAIGFRATVTADGSVAVGANTTVNSANSVVVGADALVESGAVGSSAIGQNARVASGAGGSVALGQNSVANQANTVSVGSVGSERRITNVTAGNDFTDAANVGQVRQVEAALGVETSNRMNADAVLQSNIERTDIRLDNVGALASAFSALVPNARASGNSQLSVGLGNYRSTTALAAGLFHYTNNNVLINVGVSHTFTRRETAARAGATFSW